jgi:hypothetical protein
MLLTELSCYRFLLDYFEHDQLRRSRLEIRKVDYRANVPALVCEVVQKSEKNNDWIQARRTIPAVANRYAGVFRQTIAQAFGESMARTIAEIERTETYELDGSAHICGDPIDPGRFRH